jgi:replicative DNA helicase
MEGPGAEVTDLADHHAEQALVGLAVMSPAAARAVLDRGLAPEQLASPRHRLVLGAIRRLVADGADPDVPSICAVLADHGKLDDVGGPVAVDGLAAHAAGVGAIQPLIDRVISLAGWRRRRNVARDLIAACDATDGDLFDEAEARLFTDDAPTTRRADWAPADAAADFMTTFDGAPVDVFPWPFQKLNVKSDGGAARGEVTVMAGPVTHGKSCLLDMALESMHKPDSHVRLYLNEMKRNQRLARVCARRSGVELSKIQKAMRRLEPLAPGDRTMVQRSWEHYPVHITECSGWTIDRICRDARRQGCDVMALDIVNRLPFGASDRSRTHQLDDAANQLDQLAKECDMHVIVVAHLNRLRAAPTGRPPMPALSDIKECAALVEIADNVLFVWRDTDEAGDPTDTGNVRFAKNRTGELGGLEVRFDGPHQRFLPIDRHLEVAA